MPLTPTQRRDLLTRYRARIDALVTAGGVVVERSFRQIGTLNDDDIERLAAEAAERIADISTRAAATTSAVVATITDSQVGTPTTLVGVDWRGPFTFGWAALGRGETFTAAIESAAARADAAGRNAVTSTARQAAAVSAPPETRWRRLLDADPCDWCVTVSGQTYLTADSADFGHDRCSCMVVPA